MRKRLLQKNRKMRRGARRPSPSARVEALPAAPAAPATASSSATATEAATAAAAIAPAALGSRASLVDVHATPLQVGAVQRSNRSLRLLLARHLDEAEALRLPAELVFDDRRRIDLSVRGKH